SIADGLRATDIAVKPHLEPYPGGVDTNRIEDVSRPIVEREACGIDLPQPGGQERSLRPKALVKRSLFDGAIHIDLRVANSAHDFEQQGIFVQGEYFLLLGIASLQESFAFRETHSGIDDQSTCKKGVGVGIDACCGVCTVVNDLAKARD